MSKKRQWNYAQAAIKTLRDFQDQDDTEILSLVDCILVLADPEATDEQVNEAIEKVKPIFESLHSDWTPLPPPNDFSEN